MLSLIAEGLSNDGIAERLTISPRTVETPQHELLTKLGDQDAAVHHHRVHAVLTYLRYSS